MKDFLKAKIEEFREDVASPLLRGDVRHPEVHDIVVLAHAVDICLGLLLEFLEKIDE